MLQLDEPPLRARGKDIDVLAQHMLDRFKKVARRRLRGFAPDTIAAIHNYGWPGDVRELINRIRRAIVMSKGQQTDASDLELGDYVEVGPVSLADSRKLGVSRVTLYRLLDAHGLRADPSAMPAPDTSPAA